MATTYGQPTSELIRRQTPPKDFVPKDFAEMYQNYYVYVLRLLTKQGIHFQDADDVAQLMFLKMDEKGLLAQFDPEIEGANGRRAVFSTFLSGFVLKYAMSFRKTIQTRERREKHYMDVALTSDDSEPMVTWGEVNGPTFENEYTEIRDSEFVAAMRDHLRLAKRGRKDSQLDLVALFDEINRQTAETGKYSTTELMIRFGVSRPTVHNWLEKLRVEVAKAVEIHG